MNEIYRTGTVVIRLLAMTVGWVTLTACTTTLVESRHVSAQASGPIEGVAYALPKTIVNVTVTKATVNGKDAYQLSAPEIKTSPDARHQYVARVNESGWSSDKVKLTKGSFVESGSPKVDDTYMAAVDASADDKTADVLKNATKSFATVFYGIPSGVQGHTAGPKTSVSLEFDPADTKDLARVNAVLVANGMRATFACMDCGSLTDPPAQDVSVGGIVYRAKRPITVTLSRSAGKPQEIARFELLTYNTSPLLFAKVERNAFTKTDTKVRFAEGSLTLYDVEKGSEFSNAAALPGDIVGLWLQGPTDALTGRKQRITAQKELLAEQIELVKKQGELAKALKELKEAGDKTPQPPPSPPAAPAAPTDDENEEAGE